MVDDVDFKIGDTVIHLGTGFGGIVKGIYEERVIVEVTTLNYVSTEFAGFSSINCGGELIKFPQRNGFTFHKCQLSLVKQSIVTDDLDNWI